VTTPLVAGALLIAHPTLLDPNFKRTVTLLAEHSTSGSLGYVLNRKLELTLREVLPDSYLQTVFDAPLYWGGPCQNDTLHCIHRLGTRVPDTIKLAEGVYWGGNFEAMQDLLVGGGVDVHDFRFFIGYAGWNEQQLNDEMNDNAWLLSGDTSQFVFTSTTKNVWHRALHQLGANYATLANTPEHPSMN
jgi:putative transcriptional regulator